MMCSEKRRIRWIDCQIIIRTTSKLQQDREEKVELDWNIIEELVHQAAFKVVRLRNIYTSQRLNDKAIVEEKWCIENLRTIFRSISNSELYNNNLKWEKMNVMILKDVYKIKEYLNCTNGWKTLLKISKGIFETDLVSPLARWKSWIWIWGMDKVGKLWVLGGAVLHSLNNRKASGMNYINYEGAFKLRWFCSSP